MREYLISAEMRFSQFLTIGDRSEQRNEAAIDDAHSQCDDNQHRIRAGKWYGHCAQANHHESELLQSNAIDALVIGQIAEHQSAQARCDANAHNRRILIFAGILIGHIFSHVHVRHKVADQRDRNGQCPNDVTLLLPIVNVDQ